MKIKIRHVSKYADVWIEHDGAMIVVGLLNDRERRTLAEELQEAVDELLRDLPGEEKPAA